MPEFLASQAGASALVLVLGTVAVMLLIASLVAGQARQELRMSIAETEAGQVQALIVGAFNEAAVRADTDPTWPSPPDDGASYCTPAPPYPSVCLQALGRRNVSTLFGETVQIPLRVVWRTGSNEPPRATYGWILIDPTTDRVQDILYYRQWCTPPSDIAMGTCEQGG